MLDAPTDDQVETIAKQIWLDGALCYPWDGLSEIVRDVQMARVRLTWERIAKLVNAESEMAEAGAYGKKCEFSERRDGWHACEVHGGSIGPNFWADNPPLGYEMECSKKWHQSL
jgi:hypothetical protein